MLNRRQWLTLVPLVGVAGLAGLPRSARAAATTPVTTVSAPNNSIGAIVAATGKALIEVKIDDTLADDQIVIAGGIPVVISQRLLRKGTGAASSRFLDDARNATRIGGNIKTALSDALPDLAARFDTHHHEWAKPFASKAVVWTRQLSKLGLGSVRDDHGRVYLLEWAGATIDPDAGASPKGLARAPEQPSQPTLAAYQDYIGDLIAALS